MKKILATDNSLKIISVLIAICIWVYIALIMDPAIEISVRDLPIQFTGQEALDSKNLAVISESATSVSIKIKGSRRKIGNNDMKSIIAKADVSAAIEGTSDIPIEIVIPFENQGISSQTLYSVAVTAEPIAEKQFDVNVNTIGSLAEGYMCGDIKAEPEQVTLKGPKSAIEQIGKVGVLLDYAGADVDIDAALPVIFYNEDGREITALDAILTRFTANPDKVSLHCPVVKIHEVKVEASFGWQELPKGFEYSVNPSVLYIYSQGSIASKTEKILTQEIPLDKLLENDKVKVDLIIPDGVKVLTDISEVEVSVKK